MSTESYTAMFKRLARDPWSLTDDDIARLTPAHRLLFAEHCDAIAAEGHKIIASRRRKDREQ